MLKTLDKKFFTFENIQNLRSIYTKLNFSEMSDIDIETMLDYLKKSGHYYLLVNLALKKEVFLVNVNSDILEIEINTPKENEKKFILLGSTKIFIEELSFKKIFKYIKIFYENQGSVFSQIWTKSLDKIEKLTEEKVEDLILSIYNDIKEKKFVTSASNEIAILLIKDWQKKEYTYQNYNDKVFLDILTLIVQSYLDSQQVSTFVEMASLTEEYLLDFIKDKKEKEPKENFFEIIKTENFFFQVLEKIRKFLPEILEKNLKPQKFLKLNSKMYFNKNDIDELFLSFFKENFLLFDIFDLEKKDFTLADITQNNSAFIAVNLSSNQEYLLFFKEEQQLLFINQIKSTLIYEPNNSDLHILKNFQSKNKEGFKFQIDSLFLEPETFLSVMNGYFTNLEIPPKGKLFKTTFYFDKEKYIELDGKADLKILIDKKEQALKWLCYFEKEGTYHFIPIIEIEKESVAVFSYSDQTPYFFYIPDRLASLEYEQLLELSYQIQDLLLL